MIFISGSIEIKVNTGNKLVIEIVNELDDYSNLTRHYYKVTRYIILSTMSYIEYSS